MDLEYSHGYSQNDKITHIHTIFLTGECLEFLCNPELASIRK